MMSRPEASAPKLGDRPWLATRPAGVQLDTFNGRPSAGLVSTDFGALLFWQFFGHGTHFGLWLYLPLSDEEAEYIVEHPHELMLDGLRQALVGRQGLLALSENGRVRARGSYTLRESKDHATLVRDLLRAVSDGLRSIGKRQHTHRPVEVDTDSGEAAAAARELVEDTLTGCP